MKRLFLNQLIMNVDQLITQLSEPPHRLLSEPQLQFLCLETKKLLAAENSVPCVPLPAVICGDLHGQFYDVLELFRLGGPVNQTHYVFLGDYVDRGHNSVEVWQLLMLLKLRYPKNIFLIRGNHESRQITQVYGFYDECIRKYGNPSAWRFCVEVFDYLPLGAIVGETVFCVHGGLSPLISSVDQIRMIDRVAELPSEGGLTDLMWSDPEDIRDWLQNPRGAGWIFGNHPTREFLHINGLSLIARAHQLVQEGYRYTFSNPLDMPAIPGSEEGLLVTVWSAPNYCYRCGNLASVFKLSENKKRVFETFKEVEASAQAPPPRMVVPYFV